MAELTLTQLIDPEILQEIQDGFAQVTGMAALTTDAQGVAVTTGSNFTDFCMRHTRQSKKGCARCEECDRHGGEITQNTGHATAYVCHAGLMDFAAPIEVEGRFVGSFIGGQVLYEEPEEQKYVEIANELDINPDEFIEALHKVAIVPRERVEAAAKFLQTIAKILSSMAFTSYNTSEMNVSLITSMDATSNVLGEARMAADESARAIKEMDAKFKALSELAEQCQSEIKNCADIVNVIQDNATTTHILGLNASIEASRAKEEGKGFGVIAQEVRALADTSKMSADTIKNKINHVADKTSSMAESAAQAKGIVDSCMTDITKLKELLVQLQSSSY